MKRFIVVLVALTACAPTWHNAANTMRVISTAAIGADCGSTVYQMEHVQDWYEHNPLLGRYPSVPRVIGTCSMGMVANATIPTVVKSSKARLVWWTAFTIIEATVVVHNLNVK